MSEQLATVVAATPPRIIQLYCACNLGDHVYNFFLFYHIHDILCKENIIIEYRCNEQYHAQLREFIPSPERVRLVNYCGDHDKIGINMHIGSGDLRANLWTKTHPYFDKFYLEYYLDILEKMNIPKAIAAAVDNPPLFQYTDPELLIRYDFLPVECKDIDVLIINSSPRSGQYAHYGSDIEYWNYFAYRLMTEKNLKIITTEKYDSRIKCTTDYSLSVKSIGSLSTRAKVIISINTGPLSPCYNTYTLENVRKIYMFHSDHKHIHPKVVQPERLVDVDIDEVVELCRV